MTEQEEREPSRPIQAYRDIVTPPPSKDEPLLDHRAMRSISKRSGRAGCASLLILLATIVFMIPFLLLFLVSAYYLHAEPYYLIPFMVGAMGSATGALTIWAAFHATRSNARRHVQLDTYARDLESRQRAQHGSISLSHDEQEMHGALDLLDDTRQPKEAVKKKTEDLS